MQEDSASGSVGGASGTEKDDLRDELAQKLKLLDAQIARFKRENEQCKKLRLEREGLLKETEAEAERGREELRMERDALGKELDEEKEKMRKERART